MSLLGELSKLGTDTSAQHKRTNHDQAGLDRPLVSGCCSFGEVSLNLDKMREKGFKEPSQKARQGLLRLGVSHTCQRRFWEGSPYSAQNKTGAVIVSAFENRAGRPCE
jgi:hypothetical protein